MTLKILECFFFDRMCGKHTQFNCKLRKFIGNHKFPITLMMFTFDGFMGKLQLHQQSFPIYF